MTSNNIAEPLYNFKLKIQEAVGLVSEMGAEQKLQAVHFWNMYSEKLQEIVNHSAADINALEIAMENDKVNVLYTNQNDKTINSNYTIIQQENLLDNISTNNGQLKFETNDSLKLNENQQEILRNLNSTNLELIRQDRINNVNEFIKPSTNIGDINFSSNIELTNQNEIINTQENNLSSSSLQNNNTNLYTYDNYSRQNVIVPLTNHINHINNLNNQNLIHESKTNSNDSESTNCNENVFDNSNDCTEMTDNYINNQIMPTVDKVQRDMLLSDNTNNIRNNNLNSLNNLSFINLCKLNNYNLQALNENIHSDISKSDKSVNFQEKLDNNQFLEQVQSSENLTIKQIYNKNQIDNDNQIIKKVDTSKSHNCTTCNSKFSTKGNLIVHQRRHTGEKPFICDKCSSCFSTKGNLKRHIKAHTGERPWQCELCESKFTEKKSLKVHMRRHTGEKPYKCQECGKAFSQTGVLQTHMTLHLDERKFLCKLCGKAFRQRSQLKLHELRHEGIKKWSCDNCTSKFLTKGDLERHYRVHTGERPFVCDLCGRTFTRQQSLNEHSNRHYGLKPYSCSVCNKKFVEMSACYKHIKIHKKQNCLSDQSDAIYITNNELSLDNKERCMEL